MEILRGMILIKTIHSNLDKFGLSKKLRKVFNLDNATNCSYKKQSADRDTKESLPSKMRQFWNIVFMVGLIINFELKQLT